MRQAELQDASRRLDQELQGRSGLELRLKQRQELAESLQMELLEEKMLAAKGKAMISGLEVELETEKKGTELAQEGGMGAKRPGIRGIRFAAGAPLEIGVGHHSTAPGDSIESIFRRSKLGAAGRRGAVALGAALRAGRAAFGALGAPRGAGDGTAAAARRPPGLGEGSAGADEAAIPGGGHAEAQRSEGGGALGLDQ